MRSCNSKNFERFKKIHKMLKEVYQNFVLKITTNSSDINTQNFIIIEKGINDIIETMELYIH